MLKNINVEVDMTMAFVKTLMSNDIPERIKELRLSALKELYNYLKHYEELGYVDKLICKIAEKKIDMIMKIETKEEKDKVIKPKCPQFYGDRFLTDEYSVPEEELICWSEASLRAPLNEHGFNRYMELFKKIFPDEEKIFSQDDYTKNNIEDDLDEIDI